MYDQLGVKLGDTVTHPFRHIGRFPLSKRLLLRKRFVTEIPGIERTQTLRDRGRIR